MLCRCVKKLNEEVYRLEVEKLIIGDVHGNGEEEASVAAIDELVVVVLDKVCTWREKIEMRRGGWEGRKKIALELAFERHSAQAPSPPPG